MRACTATIALRHGLYTYGWQQPGIVGNGRKPDRATQGVRIMRLNGDDTVASLTLFDKNFEDLADNEAESGAEAEA